MVPDPTTVWMVREGDPAAIEGTLSIGEGVLTFEPSSGAARVSVPIADIRKARRARTSPVLSVSLSSEAEGGKLYFFFSKPPPLPGGRRDSSPGIFRSARGLDRATAAMSLRAASALVKGQIDECVRELRKG